VSGQPSRLKKNKKGSAPAEPDELPEYTAEQARAVLFGAGDQSLMLSKIEKFTGLVPSSFDELIEFQAACLEFRPESAGYSLHQQWQRKVCEPLVFATLHRWVYGGSSCNLGSLPGRESFDSLMVHLVGSSSYGKEVAARVELALHICRLWKIMLPPAWLRDLAFMNAYHDRHPVQADSTEELFDALYSRMCEQAIITFRADLVGDNSTLKTEELVAKFLNIALRTVQGRRNRANSLLGAYYQPAAVPGTRVMMVQPSDLLIFRVPLYEIKEAIAARFEKTY
jgi:hypothetical protein